MRVVAITLANFRLMIRDRSNLVSMIVVPLAFVFLIGAQFGGESAPTVSVARTGPLADDVARLLADDGTVSVARPGSPADVADAVGRGDAALGVILPADAVERLAALDDVQVEVISRSDQGSDLRTVVDEAVSRATMASQVTARLARQPGAPHLDEVADVVAGVEARVGRIDVVVVDGIDADDRRRGRFDEGASQQLVLMTFMFTLFSAIPMAQSRQHGITHRVAATPTPMRTIVTGEACGRWVVAVAQGTYIMVASALLFGVEWGDLVGAAVTLALFGAVGAGAGMLLGASFDDEGVLVGLGVVIGLAVAAIGGAMLPTELMGGTLRQVARVTPHSWAIDSFTTLGRGGGVADVATELGVLAAMAAALLVVASWRLRAVLRRA